MKDEQNTDLEKTNKIFDIRERGFAFAVRIVKLCKFLERKSDVSKAVLNQLLRAGTSVGANLEESIAGQSKADFIHKNSISLKEARESSYWLRLILETSDFEENIAKGVRDLQTESLEIANIIGTIIIKAKS